jgi:hypothetical protein
MQRVECARGSDGREWPDWGWTRLKREAAVGHMQGMPLQCTLLCCQRASDRSLDSNTTLQWPDFAWRLLCVSLPLFLAACPSRTLQTQTHTHTHTHTHTRETKPNPTQQVPTGQRALHGRCVHVSLCICTDIEAHDAERTRGMRGRHKQLQSKSRSVHERRRQCVA